MERLRKRLLSQERNLQDSIVAYNNAIDLKMFSLAASIDVRVKRQASIVLGSKAAFSELERHLNLRQLDILEASVPAVSAQPVEAVKPARK